VEKSLQPHGLQHAVVSVHHCCLHQLAVCLDLLFQSRTSLDGQQCHHANSVRLTTKHGTRTRWVAAANRPSESRARPSAGCVVHGRFCHFHGAIFYMGSSRPKGFQPAAYGHVQTLTDLIDNWSKNMYWGHKSWGEDWVAHAGTCGSRLLSVDDGALYAGAATQEISGRWSPGSVGGTVT
jgi:hypothetical protein